MEKASKEAFFRGGAKKIYMHFAFFACKIMYTKKDTAGIHGKDFIV